MSTPKPMDARLDPARIAAELRNELAELSEGKLTADAIDEGGHLFDYGYVDSLSAVTFLARIEDRYGVRIDDVDLVERLHTVRSIAEYVAENG